jgi:hypothetical protein
MLHSYFERNAIVKIQQAFAVSAGIAVSLSLQMGASTAMAQANTDTSLLAQSEMAEPEETCVALQEVTTGATEIRKRIENGVISRGNWNTDFLVPADQNFSYFVALVTPENTAPYELTINLRLPTGGAETAFSKRADVEAGTTFSIPFQSPTGRQPAVINARVGGVNGNFYTLAVAACE